MLDYNLPIPDQPTHHQVDSSKLNCFMECPRMFFFQYLLGWRSERPNNHLVFGTAWHLALEHLLLHGYTQATVLEAFNLFNTSYHSTLTNPEDDELFWPKTPDRAFQCLAEYAMLYQHDLEEFDTIYTEIAFTVQMDKTRSLIGRMDSILQSKKTGKFRSRDHKTCGSLQRVDEKYGMDMQTGTYTHAQYCLLNPDMVDGVEYNLCAFKKVKGTRGGKIFDFIRVPAFRSRSQMQTWYTNTLYWMDALEREYQLLEKSSKDNEVLMAFPMNTTNCDKWFGCQYKDFCNAWPNPLKKCFRPPIGMIEEHWNPHAEEASVTMELAVGAEPIIEKGAKNA